MTIIKHSDELIKYISSLDLNLTKPQEENLLNLLSGIINLEGNKNISNLNRSILNSKNRSTLSRFLSSSTWDELDLNSKRLEYSYKALLRSSKETMFLIIDDTLITKSRNSKHIDGMGFLHSHCSGKSEWSHCQVALQGKVGDFSIPLDYKLYLKEEYCIEKDLEFKSKNDLALELIDRLELEEERRIYLLVDSWYSSSKLLMESLARGIYTICPLKSNRIFYPQGISMQLKKYEKQVDKSSLNLVTVKGEKYYVHRYEGNLKEVENTVILFCYKFDENGLRNPKYILSMDIDLSDREIIEFYLNRWDIEVSFRYQKNSLGLGDYQMRNLKGITRYWYLVYLSHNFLVLKQQSSQKNLGEIILDERTCNKAKTILGILNLKEEGYSNREIVEMFVKKCA